MARRLAAVVGICALTSAVCAVGGGLRAGAGATAQRGLSVGDVRVYEGDVGPAKLRVPVDLSGPVATIVKVPWSLQPVNATPGSDYTAAHGTLTFGRNVVAKALSVTIWGDRDGEPDESFKVVLGAPIGDAYLERGAGTVTIRNDDAPAPALGARASVTPHADTIDVTIGDATVVEGDSGVHLLYLPVTLSEPAPAKIRVDVSTICGAATVGTDYLPSAKSLTFNFGQRSKDLVFRIIANTTPEQLKSFVDKITLHLGSADVTVPDGSVTIIDNDNGSGPPPAVDRVSVANDGSEAVSYANASECRPAVFGSRLLAISSNGTKVLFDSDAINLAPGANDGRLHIYLRDRTAGTTEEVDLANDGSVAGLSNGNAWMNANGRYVLFPSRVGSAPTQLLLRDRVAHTTKVASLMASGAPSTSSYVGAISGDGNVVVFLQDSDQGIYERDLSAGTTTFIASASVISTTPALSYNGRYLAFVSADSTLVPGDTNNYPDVFVEDVVTGSFDRINVTTAGTQESPNTYWPSINPTTVAISGDGRYVTFTSYSPTLKVHDADVFVRDRVAHTTKIASTGFTVPAGAPSCHGQYGSASNDGRYVVFELHCEGSDGIFRAGDPLGPYMRDMVAGTLSRVDTLPDGTLADSNGLDNLGPEGISGDGSTIAFSSLATNLVANDTNDQMDVFVRSNP